MKHLNLKNFLVLFIISIIFISCSHKQKETKSASTPEEKNILYGSWTDKAGGDKLFTIKKDTIIFYEECEAVIRKYYIKGDSLGILYGNYTGKSIIVKSVKDTLILSSEGGKTTYLRYKEIQ